MRYLSEEEVTWLNKLIIEKFSPDEPVELRHKSSLSIAMQEPKKYVMGDELYPLLAQKASLLLVNLIKFRPFLDANKRTALWATMIFVELNGKEWRLSPDESVNLCVHIALSTATFDDLLKEVEATITKAIGGEE